MLLTRTHWHFYPISFQLLKHINKVPPYNWWQLKPNIISIPYKSPTPTTTPKLSYQGLQYSLLDTWHELNPAKRQYTYYSHPHKQFSRIDHLFLTVSTSAFILDSLIVPCTWSDHNAVITTLSSLVPRSNHCTWYISDSLLANH